MKTLRLLALLAFASPSFAQHYRQPSQMSLDGTFTFATLPSAASYPGYTAYTSDQGPVYSNGSAWASMAGGGVPPTITANTVLGNGTASTAAPQQLTMPSCSTSGSALKWTTSTGFGCNSSINAATLGNATFAAPGAIGGGTAAAGSFTTLSASDVITSTLTTGTAPFTVASTTAVGNLNASLLNGATFADPGSIGSGTPGAGAFTTLTSSSGIPLGSLATQATNTVLGNATNATAVPTALSVGGCSTSASALIWTTNTGFGCNTSVNAATLGGATFAAPGAIGGGTPGAGSFTTLGSSALFQPALGITATGGAISLNDSSNSNTTINTGTSTGTTSIGNTAGTGSLLTVSAPTNMSLGTALSKASWTTAGYGLSIAAATYNDTTVGSGTVVTEASYAIGAPTITNTQGTSNTLTNNVTLFVAAPLCGSGWSACTNLFALMSPGKINFTAGGFVSGGTFSVNASSNNITNINTGTSNGAVHIGDGSGNNAVTIGNGTGLVNMTNMENAAGTTFTTGNFSGCSVTNGTPGTLSGGSQTGSFVPNSHGTTCSVVITMNGATGATAAHGWWCAGADITSAVALVQSAKSTTTCTLKGTVNADADTIVFHAFAY